MILQYEVGQGFPAVNSIAKLRGDRNKIAKMKDIITKQINDPEIEANKVPWWFWLIIGISLVLIIVGIAAFALQPYNYIVLVLGCIGILVVGILFCRRFSQKKTFAEDGMKILESRFAKHFDILKVYENKDQIGDKKALRSLVIISKAKKQKKPKKKDGLMLGTRNEPSGDEMTGNTLIAKKEPSRSPSPKRKKPKSKKKKLYSDEDEEKIYLKRKSSKREEPISKKDTTYGHYNVGEDLSHEKMEEMPGNNLRMNESNFSNVAAPEDPYELRTSIDFHNEDKGPQNFYNPSSMGDQKIEAYDYYQKRTVGSISSNPYDVNLVTERRAPEEREARKEDYDSGGLNTIEIDLQNFGRNKERGRQPRSRRRRLE